MLPDLRAGAVEPDMPFASARVPEGVPYFGPALARVGGGDRPAALDASAEARLAGTTSRETAGQPELRAFAALVADLGTNAWRLRQKMIEPGSDQPREEMRRVYRHVEAIWEALRQQGVEIRDPQGEVVPESGVYGLKVLAAQPTAGITREFVHETIKPTIRYKDQVIQMGEVILAVPEKASAAR